MLDTVVRNSIRFIFLVLLQVLILNNIQFVGYLNPNLYVLFLLMLPFDIPKSLLLVLSFILGISIDMFTNTTGMHAAASVFLAFCRPYLLTYIAPRGGYDFGTAPTVKDMGLTWYFSYAGILVFLHHFLLFYIEVFRISEFLVTLYRVVLSSCFTMLLVIVSQYIIFGKKQ